jgi:hypothetical protein
MSRVAPPRTTAVAAECRSYLRGFFLPYSRAHYPTTTCIDLRGASFTRVAVSSRLGGDCREPGASEEPRPTRARGALRHQTDPPPRCGCRPTSPISFLQFRFGANDGARAFGANDHEAAGAARGSARAVSVLPSIILANLGMETFDLALAVDRSRAIGSTPPMPADPKNDPKPGKNRNSGRPLFPKSHLPVLSLLFAFGEII